MSIKKGLTKQHSVQAYEELCSGKTLTEIGKHLGVKRTSITKLLTKYGYKTGFRGHPDWASSYHLTDRQKEIIVGDLFGDGGLIKTSDNSAYYCTGHSLKQKSFLLWKYKNLEPLSCRIKEGQSLNKKTGKITNYITCATWTNNELGEIYKAFYPNKKLLTPELTKMLSPLGLAVWYMGDGSLNRNTGIFHVGLKVDLIPIEKMLNEKFGPLFRACKYEREWHLRVVDPQNFFNLIKSYLISEMLYKIPKKFI